MNLKFWTWPAQIRRLEKQLATAASERAQHFQTEITHDRASRILTRNLSLARRALSRYRKQDGMTDEEIAAAFESLLENKGFEAILALLTEAEMQAMDRMTEDGRAVLDTKKDAGALDALTNLHARLIDLEDQAKRTAQRKATKAA